MRSHAREDRQALRQSHGPDWSKSPALSSRHQGQQVHPGGAAVCTRCFSMGSVKTVAALE